MFEDGLSSTSIKIRTDQFFLLKKMGINLSEWVRRKIDEELNDPEIIDSKIKQLETQKNFLLKQKKMPENELTKLEVKFLIDSASVLERDPSFLQGRVHLYNRTFGKKIDGIQFQRLMKEALKTKEKR